MDQSQTPPPAPGAAPEKKKGMPVIAWVGIGCLTIVVLIVIGIAMLIGTCKLKMDEFTANPQKTGAEMVVKFHPDLDMVSQNDAAGEMTIRNNKSGETVTLSYDDIAEGRITVTDSEGTTTQIGAGSVDQAPAWVPRVPNATTSASVFHTESAEKISGSLTFQTNSSGEEVEEFIKEAAEKAGLSPSTSSSMSMNGTERRILGFEGGSKSMNATIMGIPGKPLTVQIAYSETK